jgi:hypothetical protein
MRLPISFLPWNGAIKMVLKALAITAACFALSVACFADQLPEDVQESLKAKWAKQRTEIQSAKIGFRYVNPGLKNRKSLPRDEVIKIVNEAAIPAGDLEAFRRFALQFLNTSMSSLESTTSPSRFVKDGRQVKDASAAFDIVSDGEKEVVGDPRNGQVNIYSAGGSVIGHTSLHDFRQVPNDAWLSLDAKRADGLIRFASANFEATVEESTGLLRSLTYSDGGTMVTDQFQIGTMQVPGDIVLPVATVKFHYISGMLRGIRMYFLDSAELNSEVDAHKFAVSGAAKGTNVIDYRQSKNGVYQRVSVPTPDVIKYIESTTKIGPRFGGVWSGILLSLVIVMFMIGFLFLWRQGRLPSRFYR